MTDIAEQGGPGPEDGAVQGTPVSDPRRERVEELEAEYWDYGTQTEARIAELEEERDLATKYRDKYLDRLSRYEELEKAVTAALSAIRLAGELLFDEDIETQSKAFDCLDVAKEELDAALSALTPEAES